MVVRWWCLGGFFTSWFSSTVVYTVVVVNLVG